MEVNLNELRPWADVHRILSNMKTLSVKVDGKSVGSKANLSIDEHGNVTLSVDGKTSKKKK